MGSLQGWVWGNLSAESGMAGYLVLKLGFWVSLSIASNFLFSGTCRPRLGNFPLHFPFSMPFLFQNAHLPLPLSFSLVKRSVLIYQQLQFN